MLRGMGSSALAPTALSEPKGALNHFCQRYCQRPVTKEDVVYTSAKYDKVFQVTVTLNCMEGQQFVGETAPNLKEAEKNAAYQAIIHFEPLNDTLPPAVNKSKKRKAAASIYPGGPVPPDMDGGTVLGHTMGGEGPAIKVYRPLPGSTASRGVVAAPAPAAVPASFSQALAANPALTSKVVLNTFCMKLLKRPMQKGEVVYETHQTPIGYQSTVRLPCLPGDWGELAWAGEVANQQKQAEQNAAKEALEAVKVNGDTIWSLLNPPAAAGGYYRGQAMMAQQEEQGTFGGKGTGKGRFSGPDGEGDEQDNAKDEIEEQEARPPRAPPRAPASKGACGKGPEPPSVPPLMGKGGPLPRTRVTEVAVTGEIVEWKGKYGWVRPHAEVDHPMASKRGGKLFVASKDIEGEVSLDVGAVLQFHVYEDATGLGAEEVSAF